MVGPLEKFHSDQGRTFESQILADLCKTFQITTSCTTPYHPMGDDLVERMNRTLLNMLRSYVEHTGDWEEHLQLLLFAYRTTKHSSTGLSPHEVLFGYNPPSLLAPNQNVPVAMEPGGYCEQLQKKLFELRELVEANIDEATTRQQSEYRSEEAMKLTMGQKVLVTNPVRGKLDPQWTNCGSW